MEKAFDFADLKNRLLAAGLPAAEAVAEVATKQVFAWLKDSCSLQAKDQPLFGIAVPVLMAIEPVVMAEVNKIDGQPG